MQGQVDYFEYAIGSIIGRNHVLAGKNNQDAYRIVANEKFIIAVMCDGCGSGKHSEVGAKLGARVVSNALADILNQSPTQDLEILDVGQI